MEDHALSDEPLSRSDLEVLLRLAGLTLDEKQSETLRQTYHHIADLKMRVRILRGHGDEPAQVFRLPFPKGQ